MKFRATGLTASVLVVLFAFSASSAREEPEPSQVTDADVPAEAKAASFTQALSADSGVAVQTLCTNCNNADLSIGGMGNDHVSVVCDGFPVPSGLAQIYLLSVMPATMIDRVAVSKGPGEADLMGGAVGGGLEIERREPGELLFNAAADAGEYGWRGTRFDLTGGRDGFGGHLVGSWSESDSIDPNGDGFANLPEFERFTLDGGFEVKPGDADRLRFNASYYDEEQLDGPAAVDFNPGGVIFDPSVFPPFVFVPPSFDGYNSENVDLERMQYDADYEHTFGDDTRLALRGIFADRSQDVEETESVAGNCGNFFTGESDRYCPSYLIDDDHLFGGVTLEHPLGPSSRIRAGATVTEMRYDTVDVRYNQFLYEALALQGVDFPKGFELEEDLLEAGVWSDVEFALGSRVQLALGARWVEYDYEDNEAELNEATQGGREEWLDLPLPEGDHIVPRTALTWKPVDELQLRFSAGAGYRAPTPAFDQVCCGRQYRGNRGIEIEESVSLGVEATYQTGTRLRVGASVFSTEFDDLIITMATLSTFGQHTYQKVNVTDAHNTSATLDGRFGVNSWMTTKLSYTWLDAENDTEEETITAIVDQGNGPEDRTFHYDRIPYTVEHRGAVGFDFRAPWAITLNLAGQYTGPTLIQRFTLDAPEDALFESDDFWVANFRGEKLLSNGLGVYAGVDNMFDYTQDDLGDLRFDYNWGPLRGRYVYGGVSYRLGK